MIFRAFRFLNEKFNPPTEKKHCCQTTVSGLVMDHPTTRSLLPSSVRRLIGLLILIAAHTLTAVWLAARSIFSPRYRPVLRFQRRYFKDVLRREFHPSAPHSP